MSVANPSNGRYGPWDEPIFLVEYGDSKLGKTTNALYAGAGHAVFIGLPGAFKPSINVLGFEIKAGHKLGVTRIEEATALLPRVAEVAVKAGIDMVVVDDGSELLRSTFQALRALYPKSHNFDLWEHIEVCLSQFRNTARSCGLHAIANFHKASPGVNQATGEFYKGGPEVPGKKLSRLLPHLADTCVRVGTTTDRDVYPWPGVWECETPDPNYHVGDRHGLRGQSPMNSGEFMRTFCGYPLRRAPGLEWMEDAVESVAVALASGVEKRPLLDKLAAQGTARGWSVQHVRWVWRDGYDRAAFRKMKESAQILNF